MSELSKVITVYGDKYLIKLAEYIGAKRLGRTLIPTYKRNGEMKYTGKGKLRRIESLHIENIVSVDI